MTARESDHSRVLEGGKAVYMGKGVTVGRSPYRKHVPDMQGRRPPAHRPEGDSTLPVTGMAAARLPEEPGAEKPHAGICARGVG
jgi:hypothetical protein